jgi:hypothetical protein
LKTIGKDKATKDEIEKIQQLLKKEKVINIKHDTLLAPEWIRKIITPNAYPKYKYEK